MPNATQPRRLQVLIVTGQSGSGKSTALRALEDCGYFCVDNLPVALVPQLLRELERAENVTRLALVMDLRDPAFVRAGPELLQQLRRGPHPTRLVFLTAQEDAVVRRYSQTRRLHPLDDGGGLRAAIVREREVLRPLHELADETVDTTGLSPHALRAQLTAQLGEHGEGEPMRTCIMSFGFKHGVPTEADMVLDVRFLPNPFFVAELAAKHGMQDEVRDFVLEKAEAQAFLRHALQLLHFLLPHYAREQKRYFTLAIGCTGGRHRSVAIAEAIAKALGDGQRRLEVRHRDVGREASTQAAGTAEALQAPSANRAASTRGSP